MQSYKLSLKPSKQSDVIYIDASGIWYESGDSAINARIVVTPVGGGDVELKPGQNLKLPHKVTQWMIKSLDPAATIDGKLLLGSGEFQDNSSLVTLDNTFTNEVTVMNPVTVSGGVTATIAGVATVQENLIAITAAFAHQNAASSGVNQVISAGANVAGLTIHSANIFLSAPSSGAGGCVLMMKSGGVPANITDGVVILGGIGDAAKLVNEKMPQKIKIPAGYGLAFVNTANGSTQPLGMQNSSVTYTAH